MSLDIANTPPAPYYAVIFTSLRTAVDEGYGDMAEKMVALAAQQPGFLGVESARDGLGHHCVVLERSRVHPRLEGECRAPGSPATGSRKVVRSI